MDSQRFIDGFLKPYIAEKFANADLVFLAGSFGRALKNGDYAPQASSDADLVVVYKDLQKDGHRTSFKLYKMEDVGSLMGEAPREMMIDANVHDLTTLIHHYDHVKNHAPYAFIPVMIDEGCILIDRTGLGALLQRQAKEFLEEGPNPPSRDSWKQMMDFVSAYKDAVAAATSVEEKRFLGVLAMVEFGEYALTLNHYWNSGSNQGYRSFQRKFPDEGVKLQEAFSALIRHGDDKLFVALADDYLDRGRVFMGALPVHKEPMPYDVVAHVPEEERKAMDQMFYKFMAEHLGTAFQKSAARGEHAFLENLSATTRFIKKFYEQQAGLEPQEGKAAMAMLSRYSPDLMPIAFQAVDEGIYAPMEALVDATLQPVGGVHYKELLNFYAEDLARVHALDAKSAAPVKKAFKAGYKL